MYVGFAKEQWQTLHSFKRVEVVDTLMKAVHAILVLEHRAEQLERSHSRVLHRRTDGCGTCGSPVRMAERLGEQLLTDVKALANSKARWARARRWGVWTTELLYTSVSNPASSAGQRDVRKESTLV